MKYFAVLICLISVVTAQAYVQQYYSTDITVLPADIRVSPGYPTSIELYGTNTLLVLADDIVQVDDLGTRVVLGAQQNSGATGLILEVQGRSLMFDITIDTDDPRSRRYIVKRDKGRALSRGEAVVAPSNKAQTSLQREEARLTSTLPPTSARPTFSVTANPADTQGGKSIFYSFSNTTGERIALDPARLTLTQNGQRLERTVTKEPLRNLVAPGEVQTGVVTVEGASPGESVELSWEYVLISEDGGVRFVLTETVR